VLARDGLAQGGLLGWTSHPLEGEPETFPIVEPEIVAVVGIPIEGVAVLGERGDQRVAMLRLVIDNDAVEVEKDARGHGEGITWYEVRSKK
jgi:hypothetical protein